MRRSAGLLWILLVGALPLRAQFLPKVAVFGGYSYWHAGRDSGSGFSLNGWDASAEVGGSWLSGVADFGRQYASPSGIPENQYSLLFGPQLSVPHLPGVIPFARALVGVVHGTNRVFISAAPCPPNCSPSIQTGNAFAAAIGGGLDVKALGPVWIRAIQVDYVHAQLNPDHHTQARLSVGVVLRLGR
jgi:hypothetical protein